MSKIALLVRAIAAIFKSILPKRGYAFRNPSYSKAAVRLKGASQQTLIIALNTLVCRTFVFKALNFDL